MRVELIPPVSFADITCIGILSNYCYAYIIHILCPVDNVLAICPSTNSLMSTYLVLLLCRCRDSNWNVSYTTDMVGEIVRRLSECQAMKQSVVESVRIRSKMGRISTDCFIAWHSDSLRTISPTMNTSDGNIIAIISPPTRKIWYQ